MLSLSLQYFDTDDPDLYATKICYIEQNSVEGMDLVFSEEVYKDNQLEKVLDGVVIRTTAVKSLQKYTKGVGHISDGV